MFIELIKKLPLDFNKIKNCYLFGSRVYNTHQEDSDFDFIIVYENSNNEISKLNTVTNNLPSNDKCDGVWSDDKIVQATVYSENAFKIAIEKHEISVLECLFLPTEYVIIEKIKYNFILNKEILWRSISASCHNSYDKCRKKFDSQKYIALKSFFHSIRMGYYGIQILTYGKIINYQLIGDKYIRDLYNHIMTFENWNDIKNAFSNELEIIKNKLKELNGL